MKFTTIQLHDLANTIKNHISFPENFTCCIVSSVFRENPSGFTHAWCKLLEESFPGSVYLLQPRMSRRLNDWTEGESRGIAYMNSVFYAEFLGMEFLGEEFSGRHGIVPPDFHLDYFRDPSSKLREELIEKLLSQPDRTLVVPIV